MDAAVPASIKIGACPALVCSGLKYSVYEEYLNYLKTSLGITEEMLSELIDAYAKRLGILRDRQE